MNHIQLYLMPHTLEYQAYHHHFQEFQMYIKFIKYYILFGGKCKVLPFLFSMLR